MTDFDAALAVLGSGTREEVAVFLSGLTAHQRKVLGPKFRRWLTHGSSVRVTWDRQALAVIATADGVRQARVATTDRWSLTAESIEDAVRVLGARTRAWLPDFVESILGEEDISNWRLARGVVRAGLAPKPQHPEYFRGTVRGVPNPHVNARRPLVEQLNEDPGLVRDHLLSMLATEGTGRLLAFHDSFLETTRERPVKITAFAAGTWRVALTTLAREGRLDRGRLLDTVLAAPLRDWAAVDLGWYVGMHDALEPTLDEVAERQSTYVRLLTVEHGPSVKTAQRQLQRLMPDERFEPEPFLAASRATLGRTDKASVTAQLRLLDKFASTHPDIPVAATVRIAAEHPRADVRDQAAKILTHLGADVAAAPKPSPFVPAEPQTRPAADAVRPIGSAGELADVLLGLLEEIDAVELERAIDGLLRFADERPATTDLLLRRASAAQHYEDDPRIAARVLTLAWLTPRSRGRDGDWSIRLGHTVFPAQAALPETFIGAIGRRLTAVAHAVRHGRHLSVALPTTSDFSLEAGELNRRLRDAGRTHRVPELELAIALLRVPTEERSSIDIPRSLRRSTSIARVLEPRPPDWTRQVASYQRFAWAPEQRVPLFRAVQGHEGDAAAGLLPRSRPERTADAEAGYGKYEARFEQTLAIGASLLPHDLDVLAAHAHPYLHRDLRKDRACAVPVIDALAAARSINGSPASSALVLALAAKDARGRTAAQDAILDLARYGLLSGQNLGRQAALLLREDIVIGQRISGGLADCARASDAAVPAVLDALQEIITALPGRRDAGAFLELAADLAERTGRTITLPSEFCELASGRSASMLAKAARRLLKA